eukprot:jgi/Phyca11/113477/e_gw1.24.448.1
MGIIPNFDDAIPAKYRGTTVKSIKGLDIKSLFRMLILGPSYSGKTNLVMYILKHSPHVFAHLHVIARNPDQPIYDYLREKLEGFITFYEEPPSVDQIRKTPKASKRVELVLIDDYSSDKNLQKNIFSHYFIRGRHHYLSTIFIAHSYFAIDKMLRLNSEYVAILKANSRRDLTMVGQILFIDGVKSQLRYNFDRVIDPNEL